MRFFLITDNVDTLVGMRLAGIEGFLTKDSNTVKEKMLEIKEDGKVGLILVTEKLAQEMEDWLNKFRLEISKVLVIVIPDRHGGNNLNSLLIKYINESIS